MFHSRQRVLGRKRKRIEALSRKGWRVWALIAGFLLVVWGGAAWFAISSERRITASDHLPEFELQAAADFVYDLAELQPGQTRFFSSPTTSSERSRLLVQRDSAGVVRAAFASCTACYAFRADHKLSRGNFVCGRCQHSMRLGDPNERLTPDKECVAIAVPFSVEHNKVIVRAKAITEGAKALMFEGLGTSASDGSARPPAGQR